GDPRRADALARAQDELEEAHPGDHDVVEYAVVAEPGEVRAADPRREDVTAVGQRQDGAEQLVPDAVEPGALDVALVPTRAGEPVARALERVGRRVDLLRAEPREHLVPARRRAGDVRTRQ